jgi:N-acetylglucosaminyldiphosphoundecaprenol N-acetyl-beta-D-mannosaminyltransferase
LTRILGVRLDQIALTSATQQVLDWAMATARHYICVANVHMLMEAFDSAEFRALINQADLVVPDGVPLVWMMRLKGSAQQKRVYGPEFMESVIVLAARHGIPIGLYGSTPKVLDRLETVLQRRKPGLRVAFRMSPPFRDATAREDSELTKQLSRSGARILFVGLGCPKQERWMAEHRGRIPAVMIGVGAAFDFLAGTKPQAPPWMQSAGLEWLFRLLSEPRRLWKRYLYHNPRFAVLAAAELLGIWKP